jgi:predicted Na+-dependent transporter
VLPADAQAHITFASFIVSLLLFQLLPLVVGLFIRARSDKVAPMLTKLVVAVLVVAGIAVLFFLVPQMGKAFAAVYGSRGLMASLLIIVLCAFVGWLLGGKTAEYRVTLSISTIMRNVGLATLIATENFHDTVAGAVVLAYFVMQFIFANLIGMYYKRREAK